MAMGIAFLSKTLIEEQCFFNNTTDFGTVRK